LYRNIAIEENVIFKKPKPPKKPSNVEYYSEHSNLYYYLSLNQLASQDVPEIETTEEFDTELHPVKHEDYVIVDKLFQNTNQMGVTAMPQRPYYKEVSKMIFIWIVNKQVPVTFSKIFGLEEVENDTTRLSLLTEQIVALYSDWKSLDDTSRCSVVTQLLSKIQVRGILTLLRVRKTKGSIDHFPPSCKQMLAAFYSPHSHAKPLSVGARALSKHYLRSTDGWWGDNKGSDPVKNRKAAEVVMKIFERAIWLNIHLLPHDVKIFEVRLPEGYGARWSHDGLFFRGFLEPQMENGHEAGWMH